MFDLNLIKNNKKSLIIALFLIFCFIFINIFIDNNQLAILKLGSNKININKLVINELMASNDGALIDGYGNQYDWVELYNGYDYDINLSDYGLSDETDGKIKWLFPSVTIKSKSYLIVYLSGIKKDGLYANFSLSQSGGEILSLKNSRGEIIDCVETLSVEKNNSMSRDSNGKWTVTDEITPKYQNNKEGRASFLSNSSNNQSTLSMSEFLPSNDGNVIFNQENLYGYVELTNYGEEIINLGNYYLSNDEKTLFKWKLPDFNLKSGESYIIYTNSLGFNNNASFNLKKKAGNIILSTYNGVIENVKYQELSNGVAYIKENGKWYQTVNISPGFSNTFFGKKSFQESLDVPKEELIINEVMSSNNKYLPQYGNQFYDWIEIYNNSNQNINLSEYFLTTDSDDKTMYNLPNVELAPKNYYILIASGDVSLNNITYNHTNFKLSSGTGLFLYKNDQLIDSMFIYSVPKDNSFGRKENNGHFYFKNPTPGYRNDESSASELSSTLSFSIQGGIYNNVSSLDIILEGSGDIYYTLDGSEPTKNSSKYSSPINITKTTTIRAALYENNQKSSDVITNSYIINENHTLPVMSLSMENSSFNSIQSNPYGTSDTSAHVEFYETNSSFSIDCDFKLFGGESRTLSKKSFALKFSYGNLKYKVFDEKEILEFKTLVLRSGSQDQTGSMMRDEFSSSIVLKYGTLDAQSNKPIVLYINGKYWGVYYIREKIEDYFIENNYNVTSNTNIVSYNYIAEEGTNIDIVNLKEFIRKNDLTIDKNYQYVSTKLDIDNYIDFWVYQFILNNIDLHNYRYYNNLNISDNKIRMILYDLDYGLNYNYGSYYLSFIQNPIGLLTPVDSTILVGLLKNESFKQRFVERMSYYLKNVWTEENIVNEYEKIYNLLSPEMQRNCDRWNFSYSNWQKNSETLKNKALERINEVKIATKEYFNLSEEEFNEYFS